MADNKGLLIAVAGAGVALTLLNRAGAGGLLVPGVSLQAADVRGFAVGILDSFDIKVDPDMVVRIAWIESAFNPLAVREEPRIGDASIGLMQTLLGTARWLAADMNYRAFGVPNRNTLLGPQASIYFGAAYLEYLSRYRGQRRDEEWIVRSYNGGPGNRGLANYWPNYLAAKKRFG